LTNRGVHGRLAQAERNVGKGTERAGLTCAIILAFLPSSGCETVPGRTHIIPTKMSPKAMKPQTTPINIENTPPIQSIAATTAKAVHTRVYNLGDINPPPQKI
jgi:hypothetical protein